MYPPNPALITLLLDLWPRAHQQDAVGELARYVRIHAVPPDSQATDQHLREQWKRRLDRGELLGGAATTVQQLLDLPPLSALTRWGSIQHMRDVGIAPYAAAHLAAFDAAVAALQL